MLRASGLLGGRQRGTGTARGRLCALTLAASLGSLILAGWATDATAQIRLPATTSTPAPISAAPTLPEPIYWKQHLFLIPYKWGSAAEPGAAQSVSLFVSRDRGASWQKISDAKPQVKAFNYRAEGDGEYWFAVRTLDNRGRLWPEGAYQPELRVIVDTTIPRIDELRARPAENSLIEIQCRATDVNLDPTSLKIEAQTVSTGPWQPVVLQTPASGQFGLIQARWQPTPGARPVSIRATILDRAGNAAVYQTPIDTSAAAGPLLSQPPVSNAVTNPFLATSTTNGGFASSSPCAVSAPASQAWSTPSTAPTQSLSTPLSQPWVPSAMASAPFRLWTSGTTPQDDGLTAYGNPKMMAAPQFTMGGMQGPAFEAAASDARVPASYAGIVKGADGFALGAPSATQTPPPFAPLEPFRQASIAAPTASGGPSLVPIDQLNTPFSAPLNTPSVTPIDMPPPSHRPAVQPKLVGSRTFALEYDLEDAGRGGVSRVELWGTRDDGQTWNHYSQDDDNRSPLVVTVDDEGMYGFKILVQAASGTGVGPPRAGDEPELWVSVDLKRPIIELTGVERGDGNLADHLILSWRAQDNNLERRPISLFFSSRPTGPWSAIATSLEDTGEYAWRVERYVPTRIYLRIEARDIAGNLAAFQTREPVEFAAGTVNARLRSATTQTNAVPTPATANSSRPLGR
jgi:hypothetical protein